jgi:hypothetical protein
MGDFMPDNEKVEFRNIVLIHIRNILNLSLKTGGEGGLKIKTMHDAVISLSDVLLPFYDESMINAYNNYNSNIKDLKDECCDKYGYVRSSFYYPKLKVISRDLFRNLNMLMKRIDYLKSSIYGDNDSDDVIEDDGGDD